MDWPKGKRAFITGATSGIGKALSYALAKNGISLIITGRRKEILEEIKKDLEKKYKVKVLALSFDISKKKETLSVLEKNKSTLSKVDYLINNAGGAHGSDPFDKASLSDFETMIDTNVKGLLYVTHFMVPLLKKRGLGHIVNLGSVAGKWVYPNGSVYCASKHAVRAISEGLRIDLNGTNIRVTDIEPGMVETEFSLVRFKNDKTKAKKIYEGMKPLSPEDIAECIVWTLSRPDHVNISEMVIFPTDQASVHLVNRK
jgi:NADP-dependent 3-hydroxy acid dehydrogenase YdfG